MNEEFLPFIGTEALSTGTVTRRTLASRHDMVYRNVYLRWRHLPLAGDIGPTLNSTFATSTGWPNWRPKAG
jgi:hypothetical protein